MRILCIGMSHKTAGLELREQLAFDPDGRTRALRQLKDRWAAAEFAVLSTCNRVELYTARPVHGHPREQEAVEFLGRFHGIGVEQLTDRIYALADAEAARHLLSVASGLDSLVPGEVQIAAQVKDAYAAACDASATGAVLSDLFQQALHTAKHVRTQTAIATGKVSVASVALDCICQALGSPAGKCVLSIGAGKMNQLMLKYLCEHRAERIYVANRCAERAEALAETCGGQAVRFDQFAGHLGEADIVITSTAADAPIITADMLAAAQASRNGRQLLLIDLAVPRDVDAAAGNLQGVRLYNVDDLDEVVRRTIRTRSSEATAARRIVDEHVSELMARLNIRDVAPTIEVLYARIDAICAEELAAARRRLATHGDAEADMEVFAQSMRKAVRRIMHPAVRNLRRWAGSDAVRAHIATLRRLFDLDDDPSR